ncbi:MAG TPA: di-heme oxidoredictase family protein, partial [Thermoanaerobaculia bacterium]|nr:di-heme oxidoredictase family protein [Thermoanaerobaculia bacterium]
PQGAGGPLRGLTPAELAAFQDGLEDFTEVESVDEGLGPVFNERSCAACHSAGGVGGGSERTVTRFARRVRGVFDPLTNLGGSLVQDHAIGTADGSPHQFRPEVVPQPASIVVHRRTTPLFGLGFVDATPDSTFAALAARPEMPGRVNMVDNIRAGMKTAGKFGWKAQVPSLVQFAGDAYLNEMGITSADFPNENCPQGRCDELQFNPAPGINDDGSGVAALHDFMTLLAPPGRGAINGDVNDGEDVFNRIGCASCHVATLRTGASPVAALDNKVYHPWSDYLLHDMGTLGDGLEMGDAKGAEMRTAPLWGLRFVTTYLHDGRATTLDQAILAHDGQARPSRDRYAALNARDKARLTAFLNSL